MKRILCVHLNNFSIDRLFRKRPGCRHKPLVIVRPVAGREEVIACSDAARQAGIRPGLTLTQARALKADLLHAPVDPHRDHQALQALARWMMRFSPSVAIGWVEESRPVQAARRKKSPAASAHAQADLFLDVTGCERLFHGIENLVRQVISSLRRLGLDAGVAVAPTVGAAWALAWARRPNGRIALEHELEQALAPLPPAALRLEEDLQAMLHHLGLVRIEQVLRLPREALPARFGDQLLRRIDQAMGRTAEPLVPLTHQWPIHARMEFDGVVDSLETIWLVLQKLLDQLIDELHRRGGGVCTLEAVFQRPHAPPVKKQIRLSQPSRDPVNLFNLLRCALEGLETEHAGSGEFASRGFVGISLSVPLWERLSEQQILLLEQQEHERRRELARLIERLRIRMGPQGVVQVEAVESYLPERAWRIRTDGPGLGSEMSKPCAHGTTAGSQHAERPLHLLPCPVEVRVMVSPSDTQEGRPVCFTHGRNVRSIVHAVGPERIAGQWWEGHDKTRDYFDVQDPQGRRFWLFRVLQTGRWYLHGLFA